MITYIDDVQLREMILGAQVNLERYKTRVDSLNVFPVPDGDTGTNMSLTVASTVKEVEQTDAGDLSETVKAFARGALKGARGNSGVILSQIFKGMSQVIADCKVLDTKTFARALKNGANVAYDVVTHPKEGTILTIIREIGDYAIKISKRCVDYFEFFQKVLKRGSETLDKTPEMLPVLKQAGVVDAGGKGLIIILTGMYNVLAGIEMPPFEDDAPVQGAQGVESYEADIHDLENIKFAYCTEFFVTNIRDSATLADIDKLRDKLMKIGDCVIVVGDLDLVKVHVHTNNPDKALGYALQLGELDRPKIENMLQQNRELKKKKAEKSKKAQGMVSICCGEGLKSLFLELGVDFVLEGGQTMNPSVKDIIDAVNSVAADTVFVFPNNNNIIMVCEQAKELTENNLVVIATSEVPMGVAAAMNFNPDASVDENINEMQKAACGVKCAEITHAVRDTEMDGISVKIGDIIGIDKTIVSKGSSIAEVVKDTVAHAINDDLCTVTLYYGDGVTEGEANALLEELIEIYPDKAIATVAGGQPHYYYFIGME